ncbi:MAG: nicotinate (nicotinamide) nucleotide adenylyltransferase [Candidatus Kapabacteria bacterium]|nr:nicotinate (nicotinamide) nucleotide adenylyltransferase [Candidatus Kapabacteria bacterium]MCS7169367.1 nicotinate (nicotinamide) nucleotide adenylyltransferase [Candidatus Kapabacteria bacterium]MDW7997280.1 nicotinate (nicotinamide) nucleotide adenylyltransferase [Bacteroidota bacterium]MDW8224678.1 nicotinate (nicotinamide) nucleotide adenylyltransferase [Bacteroidota bacterium]
MPRLGIFGGSFNPIHIAHLIVADRFVEQLALEYCFFVPAALPPLKPLPAQELAPAKHRRAMVELATAHHPLFRTDPCELERGGISYTIDTIAYFRSQFPEAQFFLLIGADQLLEFHLWHRWRELLQQVHLCIAPRPGVSGPELDQQLATLQADAIVLDMPLLAISSTEIRHRISQGLSVRYVVPEAVREYIHAHQLYAAA